MATAEPKIASVHVAEQDATHVRVVCTREDAPGFTVWLPLSELPPMTVRDGKRVRTRNDLEAVVRAAASEAGYGAVPDDVDVTYDSALRVEQEQAQPAKK
jgi:hypothetical protein